MDDKDIIELYWKRLEQAISETDIKYGKLCLDIAKRIVFNIQDAEECVNDTYWGAWNTIPPARPEVLSSFLLKITRNTAMKKIRYANAKKRSVHATVSFAELDECISAPDSLENNVAADDLAKTLESFLGSIDYESRNMFIRRYWFFDSIADIAKRFAVSESKVKSQLFRVRNKLRLRLIKEGYIHD